LSDKAQTSDANILGLKKAPENTVHQGTNANYPDKALESLQRGNVENQEEEEEHIYKIALEDALKGNSPVVREWNADDHDEIEEQVAFRFGRRECSREFLSAGADHHGSDRQHSQNESRPQRLQEGQNILGPSEQDETAQEKKSE
jgi:hypothetical protein